MTGVPDRPLFVVDACVVLLALWFTGTTSSSESLNVKSTCNRSKKNMFKFVAIARGSRVLFEKKKKKSNAYRNGCRHWFRRFGSGTIRFTIFRLFFNTGFGWIVWDDFCNSKLTINYSIDCFSRYWFLWSLTNVIWNFDFLHWFSGRIQCLQFIVNFVSDPRAIFQQLNFVDIAWQTVWWQYILEITEMNGESVFVLNRADIYHNLWIYPSMTRVSYTAGLSQTGQFHVGFRSFICRNREASKHCRCEQVDALRTK